MLAGAIIVIVLMFVLFGIVNHTPKDECQENCNQGRINCNCKKVN